ncbi:MAG TPA: DUF4395 domain-containing protein [Acidimicrobiales bacterium]|nr:DUF4395 domain-containing protein [Acidimicrobiales bacterium]
MFRFPDPVNEVSARLVAAGVVVMALCAIAFDQPWLLAVIAYGFVARVLTGPTLSPLGQLATRIVAPRLRRWQKFTPGPPKRFAQAIGACFTLSAMCLWLAGEPFASNVVIAVLIVPATLEAAFGLCLGCQVFRALMRLRLVPESACLECADLWGAPGRQKREFASG